MTLFQSFVLGLLQGFTELFPVSSSGHLVIVEHFWRIGIPSEMQGFDIILHGGSLLALLVCFPVLWWKILSSPFTGDRTHRSLLVFLILATIPAAVGGALFEEAIANATRSVPFVASAFLVTGTVLVAADRFKQRRAISDIRLRDALLIGLAQTFALARGFSRSGFTISAGRVLGLTRSAAVDFSFLLAVPVIAGAIVMAAKDMLFGNVFLPSIPVLLVGVASAFVSTILAIIFLRRFVRKYSLSWFSVYLFSVALILLAW